MKYKANAKTLLSTLAILALPVLTVTFVVLASDADVAVVDVDVPIGSVTLAPGQSSNITINITVTGRQANPAEFYVYKTWVLSGGTFTGSNSQAFTVPPRAAQDDPSTFSTTGTVTVAAGQADGTFILAVGAVVTSTTPPAALAARNSSNYQVTVEAPATPVDTTPPTITITTPGEGAAYLLNEIVLADWEVTDDVSAPEDIEITAPVASGDAIDTWTVGTKTFTVTAVDEAGNEATKSVTYYVCYGWGGFLSPVTANGKGLFKLGSTVPVKFALFDANGAVVSTAVARIYVYKVTNEVIGDETEPTSTAAATTGNLFRYSDDLYIFNMGTKTLSPGSWQIEARLDDGTSQYVTISLR